MAEITDPIGAKRRNPASPLSGSDRKLTKWKAGEPDGLVAGVIIWQLRARPFRPMQWMTLGEQSDV